MHAYVFVTVPVVHKANVLIVTVCAHTVSDTSTGHGKLNLKSPAIASCIHDCAAQTACSLLDLPLHWGKDDVAYSWKQATAMWAKPGPGLPAPPVV